MDVYSELIRELNQACPGMVLLEHEPMARHTSFRIGGPARLMLRPRNGEEAALALQTARELGIEPFFMGNGSNLLVSDRGYDGFVIKAFDGMGRMERLDGDRIWAESGVLLSRLANFALAEGLTGLEFAHGIPGSLGGAVTMNAGAYGGEMKDVVVSTDCLDRTGRRETVTGADHGFAYRRSAFSDGSRFLLGSTLRLTAGDPAAIRARMEELAARRKEKQPLEYPSAGSTFKRPEGYFAAALIEECGLKGYAVGGAQVSEKHAGFVVNRGGASCEDVLRLTGHIRETVLRETGVTLELEVRLLGVSG